MTLLRCSVQKHGVGQMLTKAAFDQKYSINGTVSNLNIFLNVFHAFQS